MPAFAVVGGIAGGLGGDELGGRAAEAIARNRKKIADKCEAICEDTGWKISLDRGLDIYQPKETKMQQLR